MSALQYATINRWEEAGTSLVTAFEKYTNFCLSLGTDSLREGADPKYLVTIIDTVFEAVHIRISQQLQESRSALALTRNKLVSPLHDFPEEVLSDILLRVVFDRDDSNSKGSPPPSMQRDVWQTYRRLYTIIGVCKTWRDIIMARGAFWSVIPMVSSLSFEMDVPLDLILQRTRGSTLHLSLEAEAFFSFEDITEVLDEYGPRFRAINLVTYDKEDIRVIISQLLEHNTLGTLSDLSIQFTKPSNMVDELPDELDYIMLRNSPQQVSFTSLTQSLEAFRVYGAQFHWNTMVFSSRLAELRIEQVVLGYDDAILPFIQVLKSAPALQDLRIISVSTFRRPGPSEGQAPLLPSALPNLKSLLLEDLYLNTLAYLLPIIPSGSYGLTVHPTHNSIAINTREDDVTDETDHQEIFGLEGFRTFDCVCVFRSYMLKLYYGCDLDTGIQLLVPLNLLPKLQIFTQA